MSEQKKSGKFFTTIIIGGALGSLVAWVFGNKQRRGKVVTKIEGVLSEVEQKRKSLFSSWFNNDS